jgi:membrane protein
MKIYDWTRDRIRNLLRTPWDELGSWARFLRYQIHLWSYCLKQLHKTNAMAMSAALSFRTIFALVPMLLLAFVMLKSLGLSSQNANMVRSVLELANLDNLYIQTQQQQSPPGYQYPFGTIVMPEEEPEPPQQITVAEEIEGMVGRVEGQLTVGRIGPVGVIVLVWAAIALLATIERSLNRVFEAPRNRSWVRRILLYWSVLTLGPLLLTVVIYLGGRAGDAVETLPVLWWFVQMLAWIGPVIVGVLLLSLLYRLLPNTRVSYRGALVGSAAAIVLWLLGRWAFFSYVENVGKRSIYGALGLVPLFLVWLNFSWWSFLFGAELCHTLRDLRRMDTARIGHDRGIDGWDQLAAMIVIGMEYVENDGPVAVETVGERLEISPDLSEKLCGRLADMNLLVRADTQQDHQYLPAKLLAHIEVSDVLQIGEQYGPKTYPHNFADDIAIRINAVQQQLENEIDGLTLQAVIDR